MTTNATILLVDDDPDDVFMLSDAFKAEDPTCEVVEAYDGDAALQLLEAMYNRKEIPGLIVLDINMPVLDGRELLRIIKTDDRFRRIPVVVYTTSSNPFDRLHCEQYGVSLITKPSTLKNIRQAVHGMLRQDNRPAA